MPVSDAMLAGVGTGLDIGSGLLQGRWNRKAQAKQNAADRQFQLDMYNRQRTDSLSDWERNNLYNSPAAQMQRLKEAGLNPNLVYGGGNAITTAQMARASQPSGGSMPAPKFDISAIQGAMSNFIQNKNALAQGKQIQAVTDNLAEQNKVLVQESLLKAATTNKVMQDTAKTKQDYDFANQLWDQTAMRARLENEKLTADIESTRTSTGVMLDRNEREQLANTANVAKTWQDIISAKLQRAKTAEEISQLKIMQQNAMKEGQIKDYDIFLQRMGINRTDPLWQRSMAQMLSGKNPDSLLNKARSTSKGANSSIRDWFKKQGFKIQE